MRYLCPKHQQAVWMNPELAMTLWNSAMNNGVVAYRRGDWQTARTFLGTAFEVALLYLRNARYHSKGEFTIAHMVGAGRPLAQVLHSLKLLDEAESCLSILHSTLMQASSLGAGSLNRRERALELTKHCVDQLASALRLESKTPLCLSVAPEQSTSPGGRLH